MASERIDCQNWNYRIRGKGKGAFEHTYVQEFLLYLTLARISYYHFDKHLLI